MDIKSLALDLKEAVAGTLKSKESLVAVAIVSGLMYIFLVLGTFPEYSWQMLGNSLFYLDEALVALTLNLLQTTSFIGLGLVVLYSVLTGVAVTHFAIQLNVQGGITGLAGISSLPAFLVGGCAGCGAGILGIFGFFGAVAALPFHGNGVRVLGILLFAYFLADAGDPRTCGID